MSGIDRCKELLMAISLSILPTVLVRDGSAKIASWQLVAPVALTATGALGSNNLNVTSPSLAIEKLKTKNDELSKLRAVQRLLPFSDSGDFVIRVTVF